MNHSDIGDITLKMLVVAQIKWKNSKCHTLDGPICIGWIEWIVVLISHLRICFFLPGDVKLTFRAFTAC